MVAGSEGGLQKLMDGLNRTTKEYDMKVNIKKTKVMKLSRKGEGVINITIDGEILEQVERFRYLGALITSDGRCETEIKTRIDMAKNAFNQRMELLSTNLNKDIKKRLINGLIWSVALYAAETWTYRKEDIRRLEAFEVWVWRKMEKISWRDMKTNEEVLQMVQEERSLMDVIWRGKKNWIGHILGGESLLREVIEGRMIGNRPRGRKRLGMLNEF